MLSNRVAIQDHYLGEIFVKKGTIVTAAPILNNYSENYYIKPHEFRPDRWIPGSEYHKLLENQFFVFTPFSAGPRNCIG
jgi:cytochrome P450